MSPSIVWQKLFTRVFKLFFPNRLVFLWLYLLSDLAPRHYWRLRCRKSCARRGLEPERGIWAASCCGAGEHAGTLPGANPGAGNSWWGEGVALLVQNRVVSSQGTLQCPSVMDQSLAWWPSEQLRLVHRWEGLPVKAGSSTGIDQGHQELCVTIKVKCLKVGTICIPYKFLAI